MAEKKYQYINLYLGAAVLLAILGYAPGIKYGFIKSISSFGFAMIFVAEGHRFAASKSHSYIKGMIFKYIMYYMFFSIISIIYDFADQLTVKERIINTCSLQGNNVLWIFPALSIAILLYWLVRKAANATVGLVLCAVCGGAGIYLGYREIGGYYSILINVLVGVFLISAGELSFIIYEKISEKKLLLIISALVFVCAGLYVAYMLPFITFAAAYLASIGLIWLARWINASSVFEFLGDNWRLILCSFVNLGVSTFATIFNDAMFELTDHNFISRASTVVLTVVCLLIIIIVYRFVVKGLIGHGARSSSESGN